ncbi:BrnA antitoxin family protein [Methylorubrum podarium]|uniref:BrnA antitoxin family protein n=1 Tax=Methylorubrum podarium TaxID=200476 RepID=A0ABV1QTE5_9HYPH
MGDNKTAKAVTRGTDWAALRALPEETVERLASDDRDNPATDESHWAEAGIGLPVGKTSVHASFDRDVVAFFKRGGRGYQDRMNAVLRRHMEAERRESANPSNINPTKAETTATGPKNPT